MKKRIISVCVLLTVTLFMFVSCSGSITDTLLKVMDSTNVNVYEKTGMVKPDTSAADSAVQALTTTKVTIEQEPDGSIDITAKEEFSALKEAGIELKLEGELAEIATQGVLAPQSDSEKQAIKNVVFSTRPAEVEKFKNELEKDVSLEDSLAVKGSMAVASAAFSEISKKVGEESGLGAVIAQIAVDFKDMANGSSKITQGDKLCVQLATNVAVSAAHAVTVLNDPSKTTEEKMNNQDVITFLNDANTLYATSKMGVGNVGNTVSDLLKNVDFTSNNTGSKDITVDIPDTYKKLIPNLVKNLLGTDVEKYDAKIRSFQSMVNSKNAMYMVVSEDLDTLAKNENLLNAYSDLETSSGLTAIIEYLAASAVSQLDSVKYQGVSFLELIKEVVSSSGEGFFNDLSTLKADKNEEVIKSLFAGSDSEIKTVLKDLIEKMQVNALTADKMLIIGKSNLKALLDMMNIKAPDGEENITSVSGLLSYLKENM